MSVRKKVTLTETLFSEFSWVLLFSSKLEQQLDDCNNGLFDGGKRWQHVNLGLMAEPFLSDYLQEESSEEAHQ